MKPAFATPEWDFIADRFSMGWHDDARPYHRSVRVIDLLDHEKCGAYLDWLGGFIGSPSRRVTASTLAKRYAFIAAAPALYAMSVYDKGLTLSPKHCILETPVPPEGSAGGTKLPRLGLTECQVTEAAPGRRGEWREQLVRSLFAEHLSRLFRSLSEVARVPMPVLWENAVVRIVPLFEDALEQAADRAAADRIRDDFRYIVHESPGELFGERRNPLSGLAGPAGIDPTDEPGERLRRTCCFYYEISAEYCRRCPLPRQARS